MIDRETLKTLANRRDSGFIYTSMIYRDDKKEWKEQLFNFANIIFSLNKLCIEEFYRDLVQIKNFKLVHRILSTLLHKDMVYGTDNIPIKFADETADEIFKLFSEDAIYFSNSNWNLNEYNIAKKPFEFGLQKFTNFTTEILDSGLFIVGTNKIGLVWFGDETKQQSIDIIL